MFTFFLVIGVVITVLRSEYMTAKTMKGMRVIAFTSFFWGIIGISLGIHQTTGDGVGWGPASFLAILAIVLNLVGSIVIVLIKQ